MSLAVSFPFVERCADCERDLVHCHGSAQLHVDGRGECIELDGCRLPPEAHLFVVSCHELDCAVC